MSLQDALAKLQKNEILVLPEDERPYELNGEQGFRRDNRHYFAMARTTRGIAGLGPGARIGISANVRPRPAQTGGEGMQEKLIECEVAGAYFGNFSMSGRALGRIGYNGIRAEGAGTTFEHLHMRGAHRGWMDKPPGEAGALCGYRGSRMRVLNCEVDCRDESGVSVGSSPLMFNQQADVEVTDVLCHHTSIGMPTFWRVNNARVTRLTHRDVAQSGTGPSPGLNIEGCSGRFLIDDCTLLIDYRGAHMNKGLHLNVGAHNGSVRVHVVKPRFDAGPWGERIFAIQQYMAPNQKASDYSVVDGNGKKIPFRVAH